jgi:hypothetical protein
MDSARSKAARPVVIADHLWELFQEMARTMGSDADALINQAMFMFARANGFDPSRGPLAAGAKSHAVYDSGSFGPTEFEAAPPPELSPASPAGGLFPIAQTTDPIALMPEQVVSCSSDEAPGWAASGREPSPTPASVDDSAHRLVAERVLQTAAELERMIGGQSEPPPAGGPATNGENGVALHLEDQGRLFILSEDGQESRVTQDRFLIGRGKHCDYVISSGKVSREHAVIVREGSEYFIEDLGSSNGTWFNKQRIKRRKIADGDEYFICSDKIRLAIR